MLCISEVRDFTSSSSSESEVKSMKTSCFGGDFQAGKTTRGEKFIVLEGLFVIFSLLSPVAGSKTAAIDCLPRETRGYPNGDTERRDRSTDAMVAVEIQ